MPYNIHAKYEKPNNLELNRIITRVLDATLIISVGFMALFALGAILTSSPGFGLGVVFSGVAVIILIIVVIAFIEITDYRATSKYTASSKEMEFIDGMLAVIATIGMISLAIGWIMVLVASVDSSYYHHVDEFSMIVFISLLLAGVAYYAHIHLIKSDREGKYD